MEDEYLEVDLGANGGNLKFSSVDEVRTWIQGEFDASKWLSEQEDRWNLYNYVNGRLSWLRDQVNSHINAGRPLIDVRQFFRAVLVDGDTVLVSRGELNGRVEQIRESQGREAAIAAYALATRRVAFHQLSDLVELRGAMLVVSPAAMKPEAVARQLERDRRNLRERADRLVERLESEARERWLQHEEDRTRGRKLAITWARRRFRGWSDRFAEGVADADSNTKAFEAQRAQITEEFRQLKAAFLESMHLQAPATYWKAKAEKHKKAGFWGIVRLLVFFPIAIVGLGYAFYRVGEHMLTQAPSANSTALYFVASGGLATLAGVTFWIGRLLTKLYLSEHHLRMDAEEREIMTTTYLALTKEAAAADADRQIILNALFRNTSDGIVKDDGAVDVSLASLLSKLGVPSK